MTPNTSPFSDVAADGTGAEAESAHVADKAVRRLAEAVARLSNDPNLFLRVLTEAILAMTPISPSRLTKQEERFLVETGAFTADELADTERDVGRGSLQLGAAEVWLSNLGTTMSVEEATGFLGWGEDAVRTAVSDGRLHAIEISGRLRFPSWQFTARAPEKLVPGLTEIVEVLTSRWDWHSVAALMATPQADLVTEGRQTPVEWLRNGGDVNEVRKIVESDDWW